MRQKWESIQYVEISIHEIFCFQDKLDAVKDDPEKVWEVVDGFFMECESQLEVSPGLLKELENFNPDDYVPIKDLDDLFETCNIVIRDKNDTEAIKEAFEDMLVEIQDQIKDENVIKEYKKYLQSKEDIPFTPRHDF